MIFHEGNSHVRPGYSKVFQLDSEIIDKEVEGECIGTYILGVYRKDEPVVQYVGRSNSDLNERLKQHYWAEDERYTWFVFRYLDTEKRTFVEECRLYHDYEDEGIDNLNHPAVPAGRNSPLPPSSFFTAPIRCPSILIKTLPASTA